MGINTLGNLTYAYDVAGRRTQVGGTFARIGLPTAVNSASYDAANELKTWNGTALSYDSNGNMLSDGSNSFTWNARNQVAVLNGSTEQYDAFGRRTTNSAQTSFLYDGENAAQELSASTVTANLASGGIDEVFSRTDSSGTFTPLKDALGSEIGLADSTGTVQTSYTYDPFGGTSASGAANGNKFQYTGRENEGNGTYYYRTRFYNPSLGRFLSEDPSRFSGGDVNLYSYGHRNPLRYRDPSGRTTIQVGVGISGVLLGGGGTGGIGIVVDGQGNVGIALTAGAGLGVGASAGVGVQASSSDAPNISDLAGSFVNFSGSFGEGLGGNADGYTGPSPDGIVTGGGATVGIEGGASSFLGPTYTIILPVTFGRFCVRSNEFYNPPPEDPIGW
jgi:RHS repeat-associated protein